MLDFTNMKQSKPVKSDVGRNQSSILSWIPGRTLVEMHVAIRTALLLTSCCGQHSTVYIIAIDLDSRP